VAQIKLYLDEDISYSCRDAQEQGICLKLGKVVFEGTYLITKEVNVSVKK
jgi:hypothetical protein